jgi:hypothetical protein
MTVLIGSTDFYRALAEQLNDDPVWAEKGKGLTDVMVFIHRPPAGEATWCRFEAGRMTEVRDAAPADLESADFVLSGPPEVWRAIFKKELSPASALARKKIKVTGQMSALMKNIVAFSYVLDALMRVDFE